MYIRTLFQEIHILHDYDHYFYFRKVRAIIIGYLRQMEKYNSNGLCLIFCIKNNFIFLDELKEAIAKDKQDAVELLNQRGDFDYWNGLKFMDDKFPVRWI